MATATRQRPDLNPAGSVGRTPTFRAGNTVVAMSTPRPHSVADLALAPVLIELEQNLAALRDSEDLQFTFALELNDDEQMYPGPAERVERIRKYATRTVDLHGWTVRPSPDQYGLLVGHGGYQVTLMLGRKLTGYVQHGALAPEVAADR